MAARIGRLETKTSRIETPALLPVIHPVKQLLPCREIKRMGYEAVMTNAYTTFRRHSERAAEGIHRIIDFDGTIMTDSGGYQVLEFGSVDVDPLDIVAFEEKIGSDIAIILDKPTGLDVTKSFAKKTVEATLEAARKSRDARTREDIVWTLPIQGGKYTELVAKSARGSAKLDYGCFALGSPVEVMESYDFPLLVQMILASKPFLPENRPFHLFGAGHPLIIPLAVALGCDMFDSASYMLYAKNDRYISSSGTIRLEKLEYFPCVCSTCSSTNPHELKALKKEERLVTLARHNLTALKQCIEETKQAIWEERLWEFVRAKCSNHPSAFEAFRVAAKERYDGIEFGTPRLKDRGIFLFDDWDLERPEIQYCLQRLKQIDLAGKEHLVICPETKTKPFLSSELFREILNIIDVEKTLVCYSSPVFGLVPAEVSDVFPVSQLTHHLASYPLVELILQRRSWKKIDALVRRGDPSGDWVERSLKDYSKRNRKNTTGISRNYKAFKAKLASGSVRERY
jgi:7-cyano-7-deazaguanine tRNA-ribosyltransferase